MAATQVTVSARPSPAATPTHALPTTFRICASTRSPSPSCRLSWWFADEEVSGAAIVLPSSHTEPSEVKMSHEFSRPYSLLPTPCSLLPAFPTDHSPGPSPPPAPPAFAANSAVHAPSGARQLQLPLATAGVFIRASDPSSSKSCAGTIASCATLVSTARISGHTGPLAVLRRRLANVRGNRRLHSLRPHSHTTPAWCRCRACPCRPRSAACTGAAGGCAHPCR